MDGMYYRAGVGIVVLSKDNEILVCKRNDSGGLWQLPQGGLEANELQLDAMWRELKEETGLDSSHVEVIGEYPDILAYDYPPELLTIERRIGQAHKWFYVRLLSDEKPVTVFDDEFVAAEWVDEGRLRHIAKTNTFKSDIYLKLAAYIPQLTR